MVQSESNERKWVWLLCLLAAMHVFIFSAAFPFFNNVDEKLHFDSVVKYSHGEPPRSLKVPCSEALQFIAIYGTAEFIWSPELLPNKQFPPPPWTLPMDQTAQNLLAYEAISMEKLKNTEASQPPLYYTLAAGWWRFGKICGLDGGHLLYWLRFMNILCITALIWLGYFAARLVFPENLFLRLGIPAVLAFMPQSAFYSIENDMLSALCFGASFILLVYFFRVEIPGARLGAAIGLALAATFLTKMTSLPLMAVSAAVVMLKIFALAKKGAVRAALPSLASLFVCAVLPMACWMAWCKRNFGDFTGSEPKIQLLGWTHKPFADWFHHPIFTLHGAWFFLSNLMATFWQGEIYWHGQPLAWRVIDVIYAISSVGLVGVAVVALLSRSSALTGLRQALWFSLGCFIASVAFLGFLSIIYDFDDCVRPSRELPYFTSGRMILGALIPFLLLFVYGLDRASSRIKNNWLQPLLLAGMILFMLVFEIAINRTVFSSQYNWFHM